MLAFTQSLPIFKTLRESLRLTPSSLLAVFSIFISILLIGSLVILGKRWVMSFWHVTIEDIGSVWFMISATAMFIESQLSTLAKIVVAPLFAGLLMIGLLKARGKAVKYSTGYAYLRHSWPIYQVAMIVNFVNWLLLTIITIAAFYIAAYLPGSASIVVAILVPIIVFWLIFIHTVEIASYLRIIDEQLHSPRGAILFGVRCFFHYFFNIVGLLIVAMLIAFIIIAIALSLLAAIAYGLQQLGIPVFEAFIHMKLATFLNTLSTLFTDFLLAATGLSLMTLWAIIMLGISTFYALIPGIAYSTVVNHQANVTCQHSKKHDAAN